jgi:hypothetical protein
MAVPWAGRLRHPAGPGHRPSRLCRLWWDTSSTRHGPRNATFAYSPEEKLQILAFAYGYATHASGDLWAHTLVNEFTDGPWPDFENLVQSELAAANAIRHVIVEGYIADATPGVDGIGKVGDEVERTRLPDGDVSDKGSKARELDAPTAFVYDALLNDLPDLPGHKENRRFGLSSGSLDLPSVFAALDQSKVLDTLRTAFEANDHRLANPTVTVVTSGELWTVKNEYTKFVLRRTGTDTDPVLDVTEEVQSRGVVVDAFLDLRATLVALKAQLPPPAPGFAEPFAGTVDRILDAGERLLRGEKLADTSALLLN